MPDAVRCPIRMLWLPSSMSNIPCAFPFTDQDTRYDRYGSQ